MRTHIAMLSALTVVTVTATAFAQDKTILIEPISKTHQVVVKPSAQTRLGAIKSGGASWVKPGVSLLNQRSLIVDINRKVEAKTPVVAKLLDETGQPGVLMSVQIEKANAETDHWEIRGGDVVVLGAGTSPVDVAAAESQIPSIKAAVRDGYRTDKNESYYIWFARDGDQIVGYQEHGGLLERRVAFLRGEQALAQVNEASRNRAMDAALSAMAIRLSDAKSRASAASLRATQLDQAARFEKINSDLSKELTKAARANTAAATFDLIANAAQIGSSVMSIASEKGWLNSSMEDVDGQIDKAATREELKAAAQAIAKQTNDKVEKLRSGQKALRTQLDNTRADIRSFFQSNGYPLNQVPQTGLR